MSGYTRFFFFKDVLPSFVTGTYVGHSEMTVCFSFHFFLVYFIGCINSLYWLLSCVDHPVHSQIMGALEGPSTILTDVVPLIWEKHVKNTRTLSMEKNEYN